MKNPIYNQKGEKVGEQSLPESVFGQKWNGDLVAQVVNSVMSARRKPVAHAKTRGEVRGGGKKPWQQKGTGRARHGSTRSPLWVGGGVTHGPRNEKNFDRKVNKKMLKKALAVVLSQKAKDGEIVLVDKINMPEIKTREAVVAMKGISKAVCGSMPKNKNAFVICLPKKDKTLEKSFSNFSPVLTKAVADLDVISAVNYRYLLIVSPEESLKTLEDRISK